MSESQFGLVILLLSIAYGFKEKITLFINNSIFINGLELYKIKTEYFSYVLFVLLMITLFLGMLGGNKIGKQKYGNVSDGFEKVRPKDLDRPNPLFDIDTYW